MTTDNIRAAGDGAIQPDGVLLATPGLSRAQFVRCVAAGLALWFVAAMLIRALEPMGALSPDNAMLTYALAVPGTVPVVFLVQWLGGLAASQRAMGMAIGTAAATMADGCALVWMPQLYGANIAGAGAVILWGAGVGLMLGFILNRR